MSRRYGRGSEVKLAIEADLAAAQPTVGEDIVSMLQRVYDDESQSQLDEYIDIEENEANDGFDPYDGVVFDEFDDYYYDRDIYDYYDSYYGLDFDDYDGSPCDARYDHVYEAHGGSLIKRIGYKLKNLLVKFRAAG